MIDDFVQGVRYLLQGFVDMWDPSYRHYVWWPIILSVLVMGCVVWGAVAGAQSFFIWWDQWIPAWLHWFDVVLWVVWLIMCMVMITFCFTVFVNILAAPWNGFLCEKVVARYGGAEIESSDWQAVLKDIPRQLKRQLIFLWYFLSRLLVGVLLFWIPLVQIIAGLWWFVINGWMMTAQYIDYPVDQQNLSVTTLRQSLWKKPGLSLGFGIAVMVCTLIPIVNFLVVPAAVIGATRLWLDHFAVLGCGGEGAS